MTDDDFDRLARAADALGRPHPLPHVTITTREIIMGEITIPAAPPAADGIREAIADLIADALSDAAVRRRVIAEVNARVNLPIASEAVEARLFGAFYDLVADILPDVVRPD